MNKQQTLFVQETFEFRNGTLFWRERPISHFANESYAKRWNKRFAGKPIGLWLAKGDYARIGVGKHSFLVHRVIWFFAYDEWPSGDIDHINGDKQDNRLENLRSVTRSENLRNMIRRSDNKSGCTGVYWRKGEGKWIATVTVRGRTTYLGRFRHKANAIEARLTAQTQLGFTKRHGSCRI